METKAEIMATDKNAFTVYITRENYHKLMEEVEFEKIDKTGSKNSKMNAALEFYIELGELTKDIEDFGPDRTTDYIVKKIIEEYKKQSEKKHKTY